MPTAVSNAARLVKRLTKKWQPCLDRSSPTIELARFTPGSADGANRSVTFANVPDINPVRVLMGIWVGVSSQFPEITLTLSRAKGPSRPSRFAWLDDELNTIQLTFTCHDAPLNDDDARKAFECWGIRLTADEIQTQIFRLQDRRELAESELDYVRKINDECLRRQAESSQPTSLPGLNHLRVVIEADLRCIDALESMYERIRDDRGID